MHARFRPVFRRKRLGGGSLVILDRYFARRFLQSFLVIGGIFLTLMILIDLIEQIRRFDEVDLSFGQLLHLTLLNTPAAISEMLPLLVILSTIALFVGLARTSELVVTRATGRSGIRALVAPAALALIIGALAVALLNPIAAATSQEFQRLSDSYRNNGSSALSISSEGLWLRQSAENGQAVIHARGTSNGDTLGLDDVTIITFARDGKPTQQIVADRAVLEDRNWVLSRAKIWNLQNGQNPETSSVEHERLELPTSLTRQRILDTLGQQDSVSVFDLPQLIKDLREAGFSTKQYEVWLQVQLARPFFLVSMVLIGAAFTMRHVRFGGTGIAVLTAVLLGFAIYFVRNFAQILGENGQLPVYVAAWAPPFAAILLSLGLLLHAEDG
nr:LPS export ABC transporter permease LptG [Ruegeria atlantica]